MHGLKDQNFQHQDMIEGATPVPRTVPLASLGFRRRAARLEINHRRYRFKIAGLCGNVRRQPFNIKEP